MNLQLELQRAKEAENYCRVRLEYWRKRRQELERLIEDEILTEIWGDDDLDYRWPDLDLMP